MYARSSRPLYLVNRKILLDKSDQLNNTLNMPETAQKSSNKHPDPIITDLNMAYVMELAKGKTQTQVAKEFGVSVSAVCQQVKKVNNLLKLKANGDIEDPVNASRARLMQKLESGEKVIDYALKPKQYKKSPAYLTIAKDFTLNMFRGLHVFTEKTENVTKIDVYAQQREDQQARIQAAKQFGLDASKELPVVEVKVVDNCAQTEDKDNDKLQVREPSKVKSEELSSMPPAEHEKVAQDPSIDRGSEDKG